MTLRFDPHRLLAPLLLAIALITTRSEAAPAAPPQQLVTRNGSAMGTEVRISVYTNDEPDAVRAIGKAFEEISRLEALMTTWKPDSEISRVNAQAGIAPVVVSKETLEVVEMASTISALSSGAFDITFEALHGLWKFDEDLQRKVPHRKLLQKRLALVDYRQVKIDREKKTLYLAKKGMAMNLGGIAKGYAVDRATEVLRRAGFGNAIVQAGGDLMCSGSKGGNLWAAGIRDPRGERSDAFATIQLKDHAFSTAGDYERFFFMKGKRYHHIIDPATGYPATRSRSVTIYAPTALLADALDDAVFILGWEKGLELVERMNDVGAVVVDDKGEVHISRRMQGRINVIHPPKNAP